MDDKYNDQLFHEILWKLPVCKFSTVCMGRAFIDFIVAVIVVFGVTRRISEGIGCDPEKNSIEVLNATPF